MRGSGVLRRFGWMLAVLALVIALGGTARVAAQDVELTGIPDGATDGASIGYMSDDEDNPYAPILTLGVFAFDDEDAAEDGYADYIAQFEAAMEEATSDADVETDLVPLDGNDIDGLDGLGDERVAYRMDYVGEDVGGFSFGILIVRDGETVHYWSGMIFDFAALLADEGPIESPVEANDAITFLVELGSPWFDGDMPTDGDLIERLPSLDELPDGYAESERAEGLDEIIESAEE